MDKDQQKSDALTVITNWGKGFKEPVGIETLARGLAGHWHQEVWLDDLHNLLSEMVASGQIREVGHWRYEA